MTATSATLVMGDHPVLTAASRTPLQILSANAKTENGCFAGVKGGVMGALSAVAYLYDNNTLHSGELGCWIQSEAST